MEVAIRYSYYVGKDETDKSLPRTQTLISCIVCKSFLYRVW